MTANTPGSYLTEQVGQGTVLPAGAATFEERRKTEGMPEESVEDRAGVAVEFNKSKPDLFS
jgi:hypothetical protein